VSDALWYKDALIYELHVRAFQDSDGDGKGDFLGLTSRLDYLADLGVTAVWLLPFYPSPLKDDGYDIADYTSVHPDYGTLRDVKAFIREAHRRGLRVITELVCNHTSDQHPWFQRARRAPAGSAARDFYVWSDTPERYRETRIIFKDFETSNWTWDPVANAYYWHRFYSHQPDLNFDNPKVREAIKKALDFWFELGVDGLRLDAIPYLYERDGTSNENLPETHGFLKELRAHVDSKFEERMLLAEANQWPEEAVAYFGDGDECHMAFHFPVMPRLFMSVRMEDRFPIYDILEQTPQIPANAQWALFLRNHDELTLEMVTDEERDYMYRVYANDPQMRINLGIRRRLAPLLGNNRRRIELLNGLLFALPGTPVLYYGDEIGMGDNVYLGDRNGVRTPMQWSSDRNAGFSSTNRQRLFLPVITDPEYHYEAVNVEAQQNNPNSLLWWMKRLIALRKQHRAFGRGTLTFLHPDNRKVIAFLRELDDERILVVANTSRFVQHAELSLPDHRGLVPVEMFGRVEFPRLDDRPMFITLGPHAFIWFSLEADPHRAGDVPGDEEVPVITAAPDLPALVSGAAAGELRRLLPAYLRGRRWFRSKARRIKSVGLHDWLDVPTASAGAGLAIFDVDFTDGESERYVVPLALAPAHAEESARIAHGWPQAVIAHVRPPLPDGRDDGEQPPDWLLYDAFYDPAFSAALLDAVDGRRRLAGRRGQLTATPTRSFRRLRGSERLVATAGRAEQSNTSVTFGDRLIMKLFRRLDAGTNPDVEIGQALTELGFAHSPALAGWLEYQSGKSEPSALGVVQQYVVSEGDAWSYTLDEVGGYYERAVTLEEAPPPAPVDVASLVEASALAPPEIARQLFAPYLESAALLGERTALLHRALASRRDDPAFAPEPVNPFWQRSLFQNVRNQATASLGLLERRLPSLPAETRPAAEWAIGSRDHIIARLRRLLGEPIDGARIRIHGDFHAGQVLWTGRDFVIIDFEGEPGRPLSERRHKRVPLTDVAGMIRSFHYAAFGTLVSERVGGAVRPEDVGPLEPWAYLWYRWVAASYIGAYLRASDGAGYLPSALAGTAALLEVSMLAKALYELGYELNNRPDWVAVPLRGLREMVGDGGAAG
jgi:maltose alpha-D-glucosyltransferase / alpha-amylase